MSEKSLRAFIVRPFGMKKDRNQNEVDFDAVQEQLIVPALESVGVDGRTTLDILRAGNIRVDMFQRLLTADLVIADLSIDNANVFYELGIRHALRVDRLEREGRSDVWVEISEADLCFLTAKRPARVIQCLSEGVGWRR